MKSNVQTTTKSVPLRWLWILLIQLASLLAFAALVALSMFLGGFVHRLCLWALMPAAGAVSACLATVKGLNNYAAWIAPPLMLFLSYLLIWNVPPQAGSVFLCGFVSLVGAATGQVLKMRR